MQWRAECINPAQWGREAQRSAARAGSQRSQRSHRCQGCLSLRRSSSSSSSRAGTAGLHTQGTTLPTPAHHATLVNHGVSPPLPEHPTAIHGNTPWLPHRLVHCPDCHSCTAWHHAHATHPSGCAPPEIPITDNFQKKPRSHSCLAHANAGGAVDLTLQPRLCSACTRGTVQERPCNKEGAGHCGARSNSADTPNCGSENSFAASVTKLLHKSVRATPSIVLTGSTAAFPLHAPWQHTLVRSTRSHRTH